MPDGSKVASTTTAVPPPRETLNGQIALQAPPAQQQAALAVLGQVGAHLDTLRVMTGLNLTLAVAAYSPQSFPKMKYKAGAAVPRLIVNDAAAEAAAVANGYNDTAF